MPHKEAVAGLVDRLSPVADRLGAVNCVSYGDGGSVRRQHRRRRVGGRPPPGRPVRSRRPRCLVVGAGGAARAVVAALADAGAAEVVVVNRTPGAGRPAAAALAGAAGPGRDGPEDARRCQLVVNATPLGMAGAGGAGPPSWPVDPALLGPGQVVVDLVYHPRVTPWLEAARGAGRVVGQRARACWSTRRRSSWPAGRASSRPVEAMWAGRRRASDPDGVTRDRPGRLMPAAWRGG